MTLLVFNCWLVRCCSSLAWFCAIFAMLCLSMKVFILALLPRFWVDDRFGACTAWTQSFSARVLTCFSWSSCYLTNSFCSCFLRNFDLFGCDFRIRVYLETAATCPEAKSISSTSVLLFGVLATGNCSTAGCWTILADFEVAALDLFSSTRMRLARIVVVLFLRFDYPALCSGLAASLLASDG